MGYAFIDHFITCSASDLNLTSRAVIKRIPALMTRLPQTESRWLKRPRRALALGITLTLATSLAYAKPRIVCTSPSHEFGAAEGAQSVEHVFLLENRGDELLTFGRVRGCCGASTALRDKSVPPGTNTTLQVKLSLRGRKGAVRKSIYVASNDPKQPYLRLTLTGRVAGTLDVTPRSVDFGAISSMATATQMVTVSSAVGLSVTNIQCTSNRFQAEVERVSSNRHAVTVSLVPPLPAGRTQAKVGLLTDNPRTPKIEFSVQAVVSGDIIAVPRELTVIAPEGTPKTVTRYLALRSRRRAPFNITDVKLPEDGMTSKLTALGHAGWRIEIGAILPLSELDGASITLHTDRVDEPTVSIPVRVVRRQSK